MYLLLLMFLLAWLDESKSHIVHTIVVFGGISFQGDCWEFLIMLLWKIFSLRDKMEEYIKISNSISLSLEWECNIPSSRIGPHIFLFEKLESINVISMQFCKSGLFAIHSFSLLTLKTRLWAQILFYKKLSCAVSWFPQNWPSQFIRRTKRLYILALS